MLRNAGVDNVSNAFSTIVVRHLMNSCMKLKDKFFEKFHEAVEKYTAMTPSETSNILFFFIRCFQTSILTFDNFILHISWILTLYILIFMN